MKLNDSITQSVAAAVSDVVEGKSKKEEVKYPHMMYDPKTGKEVTAKTPMDHAKFSMMGYTHEKPKMNEISKKTAANYIGKASRDAYFKGRDQGTVDAISAVGGSHPQQDYKKSPERKAAMRMRGIDRATKRLANATIVDPRDLRGRPKKPDPNPETSMVLNIHYILQT